MPLSTSASSPKKWSEDYFLNNMQHESNGYPGKICPNRSLALRASEMVVGGTGREAKAAKLPRVDNGHLGRTKSAPKQRMLW